MPHEPPKRVKRTERRRHPRVPVEATGRLACGDAEIAGSIEGVSPSGASFVASAEGPALPEGARVRVHAPGAGPGGADIDRRGRIVRVEELCDAEGDSRSYGIEFDPPTGG